MAEIRKVTFRSLFFHDRAQIFDQRESKVTEIDLSHFRQSDHKANEGLTQRWCRQRAFSVFSRLAEIVNNAANVSLVRRSLVVSI